MGKIRMNAGVGTLFVAMLSYLAVAVASVAGYFVASIFGWDLEIAATGSAAVVALLIIAALGGASWLHPDSEAVFDAFDFMWWIIVVSFVLMTWDLFDYVASGSVVPAGWVGRIVNMALLSLAIGISEECMYRGALFGGLLACFGGSRKGLFVAVGIVSLAFGCAHVTLDDFDLNNWLTIVQGLLKICQTGIYSVMLCAVVLKTKNFIGAALVHALDDFLLFLVPFALFGETFETEYVAQGTDEAIATIILYLAVIALYLPVFVKAVKTLRAIELPQFGPFNHEVESHDLPPVPVELQDARATFAASPLPPQEAAFYPQQPQGEPSVPLSVEGFDTAGEQVVSDGASLHSCE